MKLADLRLDDEEGDREGAAARTARFNRTAAPYPQVPVHALFAEQAALRPDAPALGGAGRSWTYGDLERESDRVASFLAGLGLAPEAVVALLTRDPFEMVTALLGILKAGCAYMPLDVAAPYARLRHMLDDTGAPALITTRAHLRAANRLHWDCAGLDHLLCLDTEALDREGEGEGRLMRPEIWDHVGRVAFDDISGGGWTSSFTGDWLSREVMDAYGDNALAKLRPLLTPATRVLDIGCGSGITMVRLAPLCARYVGTDLSAEVLSFAGAEVDRRGLTNVSLRHLPADGIDALEEPPFDLVVCNSVAQCFVGHNYFRDVVGKAIDRLGPRGTLFFGNIWDADLQRGFTDALADFKRRHGARSKVDRAEELFLSRAFFEDLRHDFPAIAEVAFSTMLGEARSELSDFGYDVLLTVDKARLRPSSATRRKRRHDRSSLQPWSGPLPVRGGPRSLAYVIFTSGSTGEPKGVMVEHRSIVRLVRNTNYVDLGPDDGLLQTGSLAFDASTFEIWGALLNGGRLVLPDGRAAFDPAAIRRAIDAERVTTMFLTTGLFNQLMAADPGLFAGLKTLIIGGERVFPGPVNRFRALHPSVTLINAYGPTEATTFATCAVLARDYVDEVPLGRPIGNTQVAILDDDDRLLDVGEAGEICIGGDGVARGYWGDGALTRQKFFRHPFAAEGRAYRTGDRGRWLEDGSVLFLGRRDEQVKIRGYRVEPGEIEARLSALPGVEDARVMCREDRDGAKELVAFWSGDAGLEEGDLRAGLALTLPDYALPAHVVRLDRLPLNRSGKLDRAALPPVGRDRALRAGGRRPEGETERALAALWGEVLDLREVDATADFFDSGGHSLKLLRLVGLVRERLGVDLPLGEAFTSPTVEAMAIRLVDHARTGQPIADRPGLRLTEGEPPLFLFPPGTGDCVGYVDFARLLAPTGIYGFNFIEEADLLARYAELVREQQPDGPYRLAGYSAGGNLAFQVARRLEAGGARVEAVVMLDSGRHLAPVRFAAEEVDRIARGFIEHETVAPYLASPVLRDKLLRSVRRSYAHLGRSVDGGTVAADIHLVDCVDGTEEWRDEQGRLVVSRAAWREATRGRFTRHRGHGGHRTMLTAPHLAGNAEVVRDILRIYGG